MNFAGYNWARAILSVCCSLPSSRTRYHTLSSFRWLKAWIPRVFTILPDVSYDTCFVETAPSVDRPMDTPTVVEEATGIQQLAMGRSRHQATQQVTILRPVDAPAPRVDHPLIIVDGATADPLPDGRSAVAVDRGPLVAMDAEVLEPTFGDTTEDTDLEDSNAGEGTPELAEDADSPAAEVEPPALDFGWGIVVGELTGDDFTDILSVPKL